MPALFYKVNSKFEEPIEINPKDGDVFSMEEMQDFIRFKPTGETRVSKTHEKKLTDQGRVFLYNPEGEALGLTLNEKATEEYRKEFPDSKESLYGNVLICDGSQLQ